jgi:hypothetical protein
MAGILFAHLQYVTHLKTKAFDALVLEMQQQEEAELKHFFDPVITHLSIVGRWLQTELPDLANNIEIDGEGAIARYMIPWSVFHVGIKELLTVHPKRRDRALPLLAE